MSETPVITVDIVSDVVCPWCIIGYKKLEQAMQRFEGQAQFALTWHAFELNPGMPPEGQDINEHMAQKYGATPAQSKGIATGCVARALTLISRSTITRICGW